MTTMLICDAEGCEETTALRGRRLRSLKPWTIRKRYPRHLCPKHAKPEDTICAQCGKSFRSAAGKRHQYCGNFCARRATQEAYARSVIAQQAKERANG